MKSDPPRLLSDDGAMGQTLRRAWESEQPSDAARDQALALAAAGVGAGVAGGAAAKGGVGALVKWIALGALAVAGGAAMVVLREPVASPVGRSVPSASSAVTPSASGAVAAPVPVASIEVAPSASPSTVVSAPVAPSPVRAPRPQPSALGEQVVELDRARRALGDGDAATALKRLDVYEARFPRGALRDEADVLRVEALLAAGDRAGAVRAGDRFLAAHAESPHAARVRSLIHPPLE